MTRRHQLQESGFSLLELAIVLFILAILLSGLLVPLAVRQEQIDRNDTESGLELIRDSIYGFAFKNGRLPCPDCADNSGNCSAVAADSINDGKEDRNGGECREPYGNLPWIDLGVPKADSWGNSYTYRVDPDFADDTNGTGCETGLATPGVSFSLCSNGDITIHDDEPDSDTEIAQNVPVVVVSHGHNFSENDPSPYETENLDDDTDFIQRDFSQKENEEYDDLIIWISPNTLRLKMVEAGLLP